MEMGISTMPRRYGLYRCVILWWKAKNAEIHKLTMEKDILIQNLRTRVGEDDASVISDKTFEGIANVYLPLFADESKVTDETYSYAVAALKQYAGQKRHDDKSFAEKFKSEYAAQQQKEVEQRIKEAAAKAVEDYKKEHPEKPAAGEKPAEKPAETPDVAELVNAAVQKAMAELTGEKGAIGQSLKTVTDFIKSQADREKANAVAGVKAELKKHLISLKANNEACVEDALDSIDYGENPTFEAFKQSAIDAYEKRYKRYYGDGGKPFGGESAGGAGGNNDFVKERIAKLQEETERNANYAAEIKKTFQ